MKPRLKTGSQIVIAMIHAARARGFVVVFDYGSDVYLSASVRLIEAGAAWPGNVHGSTEGEFRVNTTGAADLSVTGVAIDLATDIGLDPIWAATYYQNEPAQRESALARASAETARREAYARRMDGAA